MIVLRPWAFNVSVVTGPMDASFTSSSETPLLAIRARKFSTVEEEVKVIQSALASRREASASSGRDAGRTVR